MKVTKQQQAALARIAAQLAQTGLALPGSLTESTYRCGNPNCKCAAHPPQLHGPYALWTRKVANKTVTRRLTEPTLSQYQPLFDNAKRLRALLAELQELTLAVVAEASSQQTTPQPHPPAPGCNTARA